MEAEILQSKSQKRFISRFIYAFILIHIIRRTAVMYKIHFLISFGGLCQAYQGESILCDDNIGENISVYINRHVRQSELTIKLNRFIRVVFGTTSNRCKNLIRRVLCLYYYPTCGINGILAPPNSICPEECFYVQNECTNAWNYLALLESDLGFINCNSPEQILDPLPHCCVDAGITMDTSSSIPGQTCYNTHTH